MTGVNIPDMVTVVRYHGIIPVPVEVSWENLGSQLECFKKALSPKVFFLFFVFFEDERNYAQLCLWS